MLRIQHFVLGLALILAFSATRASFAHDGCCKSCGCAAPCQKVCRLECGEKKVEVICWGCKKEDFCIPGHSQRGCKHCETVCENCGEGGDPAVCSRPKNFVWFDWCPSCGSVRTKTKLVKKVETVTVPSYKWVVEDMCPQCAANAAAANPGTIVYAAPAETTPPTAEEESSIFSIVRLPKILSR